MILGTPQPPSSSGTATRPHPAPSTGPRTWIGLCLALLFSGLVAGCTAPAAFKQEVHPLSMAIMVSYGDNESAPSDVTVRYSVPPTPPGKVYIMWAYTRGRAQISKIGPVNAGTDVIVKGSAPFPIQGVTISLEDNADVTQPGKIGIIEQNITDQNLGTNNEPGGSGQNSGGNNGPGGSTQNSGSNTPPGGAQNP